MRVTARWTGTAQPIVSSLSLATKIWSIGIQARGLKSSESPHSSVEADEYLREIEARQPHGPYYLCGYSFGGLVAFEMARRLRESGDEIGLVGLFDTKMSPIRWPLRAWPSIARRIYERLRSYRTSVAPDNAIALSFLKYAPSGVLKVAASALIASAQYRPGFYPGELTLFTPSVREPALPSLQAIWSKHARAISIVETAGTHMTMLSAPNAESAAASLTRLLPVC